MRQRALFVTSRAAWRWNKMLLTQENVDSPLAAIVLATEHNALCASGCQPPSVLEDWGTGRLHFVRRCAQWLEGGEVYCVGFENCITVVHHLRQVHRAKY